MKLHRSWLLWGLCLLALLSSGQRELPAADSVSRPNIVFILVDDLRWDALGCTGHPFVKTPHIDRLAKEGVLFKNFFVTISLCSPSRSCYLTGQYAHKTGVTTNANHNALSHRLVTWPRLLHDAGYETAYVGKWHMGNDDSPRPGFDRWVSFKGQGAYENPTINVDGQQVNATGYMTDLLSGHAADFVKKSRQKPFALYLAHKAVHGPFTPAGRHRELYADDEHKPRPNVGPRPPAVAQPASESKDVTNKKKKKAAANANRPSGSHDTTMRNQLRCLAAIDDGVGQVLRTLEETGQLDNTVVVFTSDNGYFWGEHGLGDKRAAYEESIRDPLLIRYPKLIKAGLTVDQFALNIDIAPTLLDLAGVTVPQTIQGRSLVPVLKGDAKSWRTSFLTEYFEEPGRPDIKTFQSVRTERWKYVHFVEHPDRDELYDLQPDSYELKNLIGEPSHAKTLAELKSELTR